MKSHSPSLPEPEPYITLEPELNMSDQVWELATTSMPVGILVEYEGIVWSSVSSDAVDVRNSVLLIVFEDIEDNSTEPISLPGTLPISSLNA